MKDFEKKYNDLPHLHKGILQFLCYLNEPIARTNIYNGLRNNRIFKKFGIKLSANSVGLALQQLIAGEFVGVDKKYFQAKEDVIVPVCRDLAEHQDIFEAITKTVKENKYIATPESKTTTIKTGIREFRNTILRNDIPGFLHQYENLTSHSSKSILNSEQIKSALFNPFQNELLSQLPAEKQFEIFFYYLSSSLPNLEKMDKAFTEGFGQTLAIHPIYREWANIYMIFKGFHNDLFEDESNAHHYNDIACQASSLLFKGEIDQATELFEYCIKVYLAKVQRDEGYLPDFPGIFHIISLLKRNNAGDLNKADQLIKYGKESSQGIIGIIYLCIEILLRSQDKISERDIEILEELVRPELYNLGEFFAYFCLFILDKSTLRNYLISLEKLHKKALENGFSWVALETAIILRKMGLKPHERELVISDMEEQYNIKSILPFELKSQNWKTVFANIRKIYIEEPEEELNNSRLAWALDLEAKNFLPLEQKRNLNGEWSKGRKVALQRLKEEELDFLTNQDKQIIKHLRLVQGADGIPTYRFDAQKAFPLMANHPFLLVNEIGIELIREELKLELRKIGNFYTLSFPDEIKIAPPVILQENNNRYKIIDITPFHQKLYAAMNGQTVMVPELQLPKLKDLLKRVKKYVQIKSDLVQDVIPSLIPNDKIVVRFRKSAKEGVKAELFYRPIESATPIFKPGRGPEIVSGTIENLKVKTQRKFEMEIEKCRELTRMCNGLKEMHNIQNELWIKEHNAILELLLELKNLPYHTQVEWKEQDLFRITGSASNHDLHLKITADGKWFTLQGTLEVNAELELPLEDILESVTSDNDRFIEVSTGLYVAVTEGLKKSLQKISLFSQKINGQLYIHPLATLAFENVRNEVGSFISDQSWKDKINELKEINHHIAPTPEGLSAELRPYQLEGYRWMAKLSKIGIGACLADDMGLGKTIQTLTLLLNIKDQGPSIVIAPASVCFNWKNEIEKFTHVIQAKTLPALKEEREEFVNNLKGGDVLICSYGLMQTEIELLQQKKWALAVLDEAHAIKNFATKRAKAANCLHADSRLVTTGTPIQNNLEELWSLFEFINPGLLGKQNSFHHKFGATEDDAESINRKESLRRILKPYILRRTKDQVLKDLPQKTEVTINIDLSSAEETFYKDLKEKAKENIIKTNAISEGKTMQVLAELTKLRLASCHPKLVQAKSEIESSKLNTLENLLENITTTGHKALVFSQFTTHLSIIKRHLEKQGYHVHYMDGKTPMSKREQLVKMFQKGIGDVFLISLKTGGQGLNLTAADYVIHMDPWWNPAVEDQASDRAHRIGQENPVTVYRLISRNTVEEKILKLHEAKRRLAGQLLKGTDKVSDISIEDLMELFNE